MIVLCSKIPPEALATCFPTSDVWQPAAHHLVVIRTMAFPNCFFDLPSGKDIDCELFVPWRGRKIPSASNKDLLMEESNRDDPEFDFDTVADLLINNVRVSMYV